MRNIERWLLVAVEGLLVLVWKYLRNEKLLLLWNVNLIFRNKQCGTVVSLAKEVSFDLIGQLFQFFIFFFFSFSHSITMHHIFFFFVYFIATSVNSKLSHVLHSKTIFENERKAFSDGNPKTCAEVGRFSIEIKNCFTFAQALLAERVYIKIRKSYGQSSGELLNNYLCLNDLWYTVQPFSYF